MKDAKQRILIVDDEPSNISILADIFGSDYETIVAKNGRQALAQADSEQRPDLILLDILMPDMDGYEVCERLKADKKTRDIPVIFITVKNAVEDETRGFRAGAADYISKPFNASVVKARADTHLELMRHRQHLEELVEQRARQLIHAERLATIGTLSAGIAHEINNALFYVCAYANSLRSEFDEFSDYMTNCFEKRTESKEKCASFFEQTRELLDHILKGTTRIRTITESVRTFSRWDNERKLPFQMETCIENSLRLCHSRLKPYEIVRKMPDQELPELFGNPSQVEQVLINLFNNAADAMEPDMMGTLEVSVGHVSSVIRITVEDTGTGIPEDKLGTIWDPFFTTKVSEKGTGLGLSVSQGIIRKHNGKIWAENRIGGGARFVIEMPVN